MPSSAAYEAYLRGRYEMHRRTPASLERAAEEGFYDALFYRDLMREAWRETS